MQQHESRHQKVDALVFIDMGTGSFKREIINTAKYLIGRVDGEFFFQSDSSECFIS